MLKEGIDYEVETTKDKEGNVVASKIIMLNDKPKKKAKKD